MFCWPNCPFKTTSLHHEDYLLLPKSLRANIASCNYCCSFQHCDSAFHNTLHMLTHLQQFFGLVGRARSDHQPSVDGIPDTPNRSFDDHIPGGRLLTSDTENLYVIFCLRAGLCKHRTAEMLSVSNQVILSNKQTTQRPRVVLQMFTWNRGASLDEVPYRLAFSACPDSWLQVAVKFPRFQNLSEHESCQNQPMITLTARSVYEPR
ncbi:hypothetical protein EDB19DRAFT_1742398 [Suillus lakei]|nr:hypothetical protein EDB19DRAFT_1742398 [Suillus lakei]